MTEETRPKSTRGFASMDAAKQREIASKGGQSVPPEKRSFSQNPQLAAAAGRKGGLSVSNADRSFSRNRRLAAEAGRKGGSQTSGQAQRRAGGTPDSGAAVNGRRDERHPITEPNTGGRRDDDGGEKEMAGTFQGGFHTGKY